MRYLLTTAAALLLLALVTPDVHAAGPRNDVQIINNNYVSNYNVSPNAYRGRYDYGPYGNYNYRYRSRGGNSYDAAVARIQATHSRFRQYYHPRSNYNSPPSYYDWQGW